MVRIEKIVLAASLLLCCSCDKSDVGRECPQLLNGANPTNPTSPAEIETAEVVEQNPAFPCDELICIATGGRAGYCSKKCRVDANCPEGFTCRTVQGVGPFAQDKFCAWKACERASDCGGDMCCVKVPGTSGDANLPDSALKESKLCAFSDDDACE